MKLVQKALEQNRTPRPSGDVLAEGIQKKKKRRPHGFLSSMDNDELISYAKKLIRKNAIKNRSSLAKADDNLYGILRKRNLLDTVFPHPEGVKKIKRNKMIEQAELDYRKTIRLFFDLLGYGV